MSARKPSRATRVLALPNAVQRCRLWQERGLRVVLTNGCFDLLHAGHVEYLSAARRLGDRLVVAINDDASVRRLKGADRPLVPFDDRAMLLAALRDVDLVFGFPQTTAEHVVAALQPSIYVKGGDYNDETHRPPEAAVAEAAGGRTVYLPFIEGRSTSELLRRIRANQPTAG